MYLEYQRLQLAPSLCHAGCCGAGGRKGCYSKKKVKVGSALAFSARNYAVSAADHGGLGGVLKAIVSGNNNALEETSF